MSNQESSALSDTTQEHWMWSWLSWRPTSFQLLEMAEKKMLEGMVFIIVYYMFIFIEQQ